MLYTFDAPTSKIETLYCPPMAIRCSAGTPEFSPACPNEQRRAVCDGSAVDRRTSQILETMLFRRIYVCACGDGNSSVVGSALSLCAATLPAGLRNAGGQRAFECNGHGLCARRRLSLPQGGELRVIKLEPFANSVS